MTADKNDNSDSPPNDEENFQRFEALTQKLLKVPKSEVDSQRKKPQPRTT